MRRSEILLHLLSKSEGSFINVSLKFQQDYEHCDSPQVYDTSFSLPPAQEISNLRLLFLFAAPQNFNIELQQSSTRRYKRVIRHNGWEAYSEHRSMTEPCFNTNVQPQVCGIPFPALEHVMETASIHCSKEKRLECILTRVCPNAVLTIFVPVGKCI